MFFLNCHKKCEGSTRVGRVIGNINIFLANTVDLVIFARF